MVKICLQHRRPGFDPWIGKVPRRRDWQPPPVFLPAESYGQRSLEGCSPWGHKESGTTERLTHTQCVYVKPDLPIHPTLLLPPRLYVCISVPSQELGSAVPFFWIPPACVNMHKQPQCPTDEWIKKTWYMHTVEYYSAMKRNGIESFVELWVDLEPAPQSEVDQRDRYMLTRGCLFKL